MLPPNTMHTARSNRRGFSLLEVIITIGISVGVIFVLTRFVGMIAVTQKFLNTRLQATQDLSQTMLSIVTEIRSMGPSGTGAYPIESASTSSFVFFSDINRDGRFERVRYTIGTSTLNKGVIEPSAPPVVYVTSTEVVIPALQKLMSASSSFDYFDANYTGTQAPLATTTDPTAIRVVRATFTVDVSTSSAPRPTVFTNTITIRNLKSN